MAIARQRLPYRKARDMSSAGSRRLHAHGASDHRV